MSQDNILPPPPKTYSEFIKKFPQLGEAWNLMGQASSDGPLSEREIRLVKLAIAIGAMREGAVHSSVRKAAASGIHEEDLDQVVKLTASTMGMPSTVAVYTWIQDVLKK